MNYKYRAYRGDGKATSGEIEGRTAQNAMQQLSAIGLSVIDLQESRKLSLNSKAQRAGFARFQLSKGRVDIGRLFADLALLTEAGLTVTQALRSMSATETAPLQRQTVATLLESMSAGRSAATSFSSISGIPLDSLGLIGSGENAGRLPEVFRTLALQYEERAKLRSDLFNALGYPAFLLALMLLAVLVLTFALVPALEPIFENNQSQTPFIVVALSALRRGLSSDLALIVMLATLLVAAASLHPKARTALARSTSTAVIRLPLVGAIIRKSSLASYLSSFAILIASGASMTKALELSANCSKLPSFGARLTEIRNSVSTGQRLPAAFEASGLFDDRIIALIAVGDEAGRLGVVAKRAAQILESEVQNATTRYAAMLTPLMTIVIGLLIGGLVISVMTALLSINEIAVQ